MILLKGVLYYNNNTFINKKVHQLINWFSDHVDDVVVASVEADVGLNVVLDMVVVITGRSLLGYIKFWVWYSWGKTTSMHDRGQKNY